MLPEVSYECVLKGYAPWSANKLLRLLEVNKSREDANPSQVERAGVGGE